MNSPWYSMRWNYGEDRARVDLLDDIGMCDFQSSSDFTRELNSISAKNIDLHVNSTGGDILSGMECYNAIKAHPATFTAHVGSVAASIASVIAMACDKIVMAPTAFLMIHNGRMNASGDPEQIKKQADILGKMCSNIAQIYADRSGKSVESVQKLMDAETWFDAKEAKRAGFADEIEDYEQEEEEGQGTEGQMKACAMALRAVAKYQSSPPSLRQFAARLADPPQPKQKESTVLKTVQRDGKTFVTIDGKEQEIELTTAIATATTAAAAGAVAQAAVPPDVEKIKKDSIEAGVAQERAYRTMFDTCRETILDASAKLEFDKLYGQPEQLVKFAASSAIALRAKPLGETAPGNAEADAKEAAKTEAQKALETAVAKATLRWTNDAGLRCMHGCLTKDPEDAQYKLRLGRYLAAVKKSETDKAPPAAFDRPPEQDPISQVLRNKSMVYAA